MTELCNFFVVHGMVQESGDFLEVGYEVVCVLVFDYMCICLTVFLYNLLLYNIKFTNMFINECTCLL